MNSAFLISLTAAITRFLCGPLGVYIAYKAGHTWGDPLFCLGAAMAVTGFGLQINDVFHIDRTTVPK